MENTQSQQNDFLDLFPDKAPTREIKELFSNTKVHKVHVLKKSKKIEIIATSSTLIPMETICNMGKSIAASIGLDSVEFKIKFNTDLSIEEIVLQYWESLLFLLTQSIAMCTGILSECKLAVNERSIVITLKSGGSAVLKSKGCHLLLAKIIEELFSYRVNIVFMEEQFDETVHDVYLEMKMEEEERIAKENDLEAAAGNSNKVQNKSTGTSDKVQNKSTGYFDKAQNPYRKEKQKKAEPSGNILLGKNFGGETIPLNEVTQDSGKVKIMGDVFSVAFKEIRGDRLIAMIDITDYTSSVTVKFFLEKAESGIYKERITENIMIKVSGEAQYDKFTKELVVMASDIIEIHKEIRQDSAEEKRVELHLHTQMSSMDAVSGVKELVKRAAKWGHQAIAITDHGVVQAFPDAYEAAKKNNIKAIFGLECYLLDDGVPAVLHASGQQFDDEFIVLDIETTGLNAGKDKITEIAAVRIKNRSVIEEYQTLVNPGVAIPGHIVKLTGITDEMVKDAPNIELVLPNLLAFIGEAPIVAHNAPFDLGFIKHEATLLGIAIPNALVDTLQLCRKLYPGLERYRLDAIAKHLEIKMENHHRAVDDAKTTAKIFIQCLSVMDEMEMTSLDDIEKNLNTNQHFSKADSHHAILLAKNYVGLRNLYKIISYSHLHYFHKRPRVPKHLFMKYREGLLIGSACEAGELYSAILDKKSEDQIAKIVRFYDYLEIQPLGNNQFLIQNGKVNSQEDLKNINRRIVKLGEEHHKPVVATCDVHFLEPRDEVYRRILMSGQGFSDADNQAPLYLRTTQEMLEEFNYLGEEKSREVVVENTNKISDLIEPMIPIPDGTFPPKIQGAEEEIERLAIDMATRLYGNQLPQIVQERLDKELNSIIKNGFSVMYIIAQKLVAKSISDGYLVGSRGSVGSSFVAFLIGITEVNSLPSHYICRKCLYSEFVTDGSYGCGFDLPDKTCPECGLELFKDGYDIPFETFLGFDGDKEPDIDLNFSGDYQANAHKYTEELFGEGNVYRAGTIGTIAEKTAYGFVKNYLDERNIVVTNAEINRLVKGCTGVKKTTGQHPGGVMIVPSDKEIFEFCPIQRPADATGSNIITTHFDYHSISGRLLKLDILGHDDPTVIKMLESLTGVDARTIPIGEKKTMGIFSNTEPLGVSPKDVDSEVGTFAIPEFGTKFVRQMLLDTKPTTFSELIRISGLSHGTDVWINNAQELIRSNTATLLEAICCRDDIMIYLIQAGLPSKVAFKIMEDVRKGKGVKEEYEEIMREKKIPNWYIDSCKKIKYMFPKAHAAAYVMMAFRIAWFKVYYPEAFYVAYFTVRADDFDAELMTYGQDKVKNKIKELERKGNNMLPKEKSVLTILEVANEMYARGIKFLPVDLYESDAKNFQITPQGIRPPLNALQGLGISAAQNMVEARAVGRFLSVDDLKVRAKISKSVIEILQQHGCLEGMAVSNQLSLF